MSINSELRKQAEAVSGEDSLELPEQVFSAEDTQLILHELQVHQIELEMQNDELRRTLLELDKSQARYFDFYDMAPVGYLTVSDTGLILQANLTTAALLGVPRNTLQNQRFSDFTYHDDQDRYYLLRKLAFTAMTRRAANCASDSRTTRSSGYIGGDCRTRGRRQKHAAHGVERY